MRIDESHRPWFFATIGILTLAVIGYIPYAFNFPGGPRGNSLPGLIYGTLGYGMMLFAGLMGARKRVPIWRLGRAQTWMRGHLWLGALSFPMILFHSNFMARGPLTFVLMTLFTIVFVSGITGAAIQHFLPKTMLWSVPSETIFEQIPQVRDQLREEANTIVEKLCTNPETAAVAASSLDTGRVVAIAEEEEEAVVLSDEERDNLHHVYIHKILPFLRNPEDSGSPLASNTKAKDFFDALRKQCPDSIWPELNDLESICSEERQLSRQRRVYYWLHGWLLVHVPLSITLLVLGGIHALVAIRY